MQKLLVLLLSTVLLTTSLAFQPFLDTKVDYAASPIDIKKLIAFESQLVYEMVNLLASNSNLSYTRKWRSQTAKHAMGKLLTLTQSYVKDFDYTFLRDLDLDILHFEKLMARSFIIDPFKLGEDGAKHPFKIYRTIRRFVRWIPEFMSLATSLREMGDAHLYKIMQLLREQKELPREEDFDICKLSVLRLNQLFKLSFIDFTEGKVSKMRTKCRLTSEHLFEIGEKASAQNFYSQAVDAFAIALWNSVKQESRQRGHQHHGDEEEDSIGVVRPLQILEYLEKSIKTHDEKVQSNFQVDDVQQDSGPLFFNSLLYNISHPNFKYRTAVSLETLLEGSEASGVRKVEDEDSDGRLEVIKYAYEFADLCRRIESDEQSSSSLKCYVSSKSHLEFILKPLKIEVIHESPLIIQYHDVLTDEEMTKYKNEVVGELRMSRTIRTTDLLSTNSSIRSIGVTTRYRTSSNAWIEDFGHSEFAPILKKIGRTVGMNTEDVAGTESIQIAAYSPGGHYVPHTDATFEKELIHKYDPSEFVRGDRLMTFMVYLSDVEAGGATVFPLLNAGVRPKKGSAVMWYNLYPDGSIDRRTLHGGCSVIYGVKWIANKWIRSNDQIFLRKCPLEEPTESTAWPLDIHV